MGTTAHLALLTVFITKIRNRLEFLRELSCAFYCTPRRRLVFAFGIACGIVLQVVRLTFTDGWIEL